MTSSSTSQPSRTRRFVETMVALVLIVLVVRIWCIEGLFVPFRVVGGSMAQTLLGTHRQAVCEECRFRFPCDADVPANGRKVTCPNCGRVGGRLEDLSPLAGDRLLVHKSILQIRQPRRWEVIALRHPLMANSAIVKRVVGLPNESVRIISGDVYIDGQIERKPLALQRAMAVLVHDAGFYTTLDSAAKPRWRGQGADSRWGSAQGRFARPKSAPGEDIDWLVYHHPGSTDDCDEAAAVVDRCGYNQTLSRRFEEVSEVSDLLLSMRLVKTTGKGFLWIRATSGNREFRVRMDPGTRKWTVEENGQTLGAGQGHLPDWKDHLEIEVSLIDSRFILAFDRQQKFAWNFEPRADVEANTNPLAIGAQGLGLELRDIRVLRDVYYTHPMGLQSHRGLDEPVHLAKDEYFVLGDNSPVSEDSRTWPAEGTVSAALFIGKPLVVHFPTRGMQLGRWEFQVPDLGKIRYIR